MNDKNLAIDVRHLKKNFNGKPAVIDVSLQVIRGQIFGFLGPNGSGKTTTIRMLCGLLTPDGGAGTCLEYDIIKESAKIKQHMGYIPQFFGLYGQLTVYENIVLMAELYGVLDKKNKIEHILDQLNLTGRKDQLAGTLSGGWKQRLSLAAALIHDPLLLLLDEPTASIDPNSRREFWELMNSLSEEGMTILLSSHNMDEVENCHSIAYIYNGNLIFSGKIKEIISYANLTTWKVKGSHLILVAKQLQETEGIEQVITFFDSLHVSSQDKEALEKAIQPYLHKGDLHWEIAQTNLNDIFVWLTKKGLL